MPGPAPQDSRPDSVARAHSPLYRARARVYGTMAAIVNPVRFHIVEPCKETA